MRQRRGGWQAVTGWGLLLGGVVMLGTLLIGWPAWAVRWTVPLGLLLALLLGLLAMVVFLLGLVELELRPWLAAAWSVGPVTAVAPAPAAAGPAPDPPADPMAGPPPDPAAGLVVSPGGLPTFADLGGMEELKTQLHATVGTVLACGGAADRYRVGLGGLLLHGPPGAGKTFTARALAGEYGLHLIQAPAADLAAPDPAGPDGPLRRLLAAATAQLPAMLLLDDLDTIARRRDDPRDSYLRLVSGQLLATLDRARGLHELLLVATCSDLDALDPAVIRPGRFDHQIRVDLPDAAARAAILAAQLRGRPRTTTLDLPTLADRTEGLTAAAVAQLVDTAALQAFRAAAAEGDLVAITTDHLLAAIEARGGTDRPLIAEGWTWDRLILPARVLDELREVEALVTGPRLARRYGIRPPAGLLLAGPPGTGKTTIARVLAAQAACSFYPISGADVTSKWVGESEQLLQRLFARARANAPSIVFIDELDTIGGRRDHPRHDSHLPQITQLLHELDGIRGRPGVLVIGATNRPDQLDPALRRGGRLGRTITIPLPDQPARHQLLGLSAERMPLLGVDLAQLAARTDGWSGADLRLLLEQAAINAAVRERRLYGDPATHDPTTGQGGWRPDPVILAGDVDEALAELGDRHPDPDRAATAAPTSV